MGEIKQGRLGVPPDCQMLVTGQVTQYGDEKDDGYYQKGKSKKYVVLDTGQYSGTVDVTLNGKTHATSNKCVLDKRTGLMWMQEVVQADIGPEGDGKLYWKEVADVENIFRFKAQVNFQKVGGYGDWRVPNVVEMLSLVWWDKGSAPNIDTDAFPSTPNEWHYSSTSWGIDNAQVIQFGLWVDVGYNVKATIKNYCRLVRGPKFE
ncbi:MAG: DUF1566 domain-containing protein [Desulfobacterales bacterium]|nr:DUF1566 domain-containing protein [Desulfobacterales bacterium]